MIIIIIIIFDTADRMQWGGITRTVLRCEDVVKPVSDDLADGDGHDGREVEEADLLRAEPVHRLEKDGQRRVDAHDPRECLKGR